MFKAFTVYGLTTFVLMTPVIGSAEQTVQRFKTLADRRDAGIKHEITENLSLSPSLEFESEVINFNLQDVNSYRLRQRSKSAQLEIDVSAAEWFNAEAVYEYDDQLDRFIVDEALAEITLNDFKLESGKLYLPFGEFYSRFVSGPALEFAETRGRAMVFSYEPSETLEAAVYVFKSKVGKKLPDENKTDWGAGINYSEEQQFSVGVSYLSDLAETDEKLLEDTGFYNTQVGAVSAYANIILGDYEVSFEFVQATGKFTELDETSNQPMAWNIELGIYPGGDIDWALRIEGSKELEDQPEYQLGINSTWHGSKHLSVSLDFLHGRFKHNFVEDESGNFISRQSIVAAQLIFSF